MISWKGNLPAGKVNDQFFINMDWMPTLASLCDLKNMPDGIDGIDQSGMIQNPGTKTERTSAFWKHGTQWVVRKDNWKLIGLPNDTSHKGSLDLEKDALFLSDLGTDVSEMVNLAERYPEKVQELIETYVSWEHGKEADIPKQMKTVDHLAKNALITSSLPLHKKYKNIDILVDGKKGYANYQNGQWIGQEGKNLEFIIDLKSSQKITGIDLGYLHSPSNWIFAPKSVEISLSPDGNNFSSLTNSEIPISRPQKESFTDTFTLKMNGQGRYVKIKIDGIGKCPPGFACEGGDAWFFIDEIIIN